MAFPPAQPTPTFPYRILAKVGEGAMGQVYHAEDLELGRTVAIKVIKPEFIAEMSEAKAQEVMARFLREARAAAAFNHAGATTVHRVGHEGGWPYIAMEWLDGQSLEAVLADQGRLDAGQTVTIGLQVLSVLQAAHAAGVIHRDIKPANLMIMRDGRVKVTDFGIARMEGVDLAQTQTGMVLGTPRYAPPEQLAGQKIDRRADLYALGAVLYELVAGRPPHLAESLYELFLHVHSTEPAPPSAYADGIPAALDLALLKALAKQPQDRFDSAQEMAQALQPFLTPVPAVAAQTSTMDATAYAQAPTAVVDAANLHSILAGLVRLWPATPLGEQDTERLLDRLLERPLHAQAFCGALEVEGGCLFISDGLIHGAFDPQGPAVGDALLEALPARVAATLYAAPSAGHQPLLPLLASLLAVPQPRLSALDPSITALPVLAAKLACDGFDGTLRLQRGDQLGLVLFSRGRRVLDLWGSGWPEVVQGPWESWIAASGALASVEDRRAAFPAATYRRQLMDFELSVVRPQAAATLSVRSDALAEARALQLVPLESAGAALRHGESTLHALVDGDPACEIARWVLVDLAPQFEQYGRASKWRALVEPLAQVSSVKLHCGLPSPGGGLVRFDAVTMDGAGRVHHVIDRVARGDSAAVARFVERALLAKRGRPNGDELGGAILLAPSFDDRALETYLGALRQSSGISLFGMLDAFSHRQGFVRVGAKGGLHLLLVEDAEGRRRPLMPD